MTLSQDFARYICNFEIPVKNRETIEVVKSRIIDYIAVTSAARCYSNLPDKLETYARSLSGEQQQEGASYPVNVAGFLNAALAHCLDYDDGHLWAGVHAAGPVIGTAFALATQYKPTGKLFLEAIVVGYEMEYRLAKALGKSHIQKGFHGSCTCGVIGSVAAAGKILGLDEEKLTFAIGLAGLGASGFRQPLIEGQMAKPIQVGYVAEKGITAALLARQGVEAPLQIFEGKNGLFSVFTDRPKEQVVAECLSDLGARHLITDTYTKLYPCCRYTHPAIEAAFKLIQFIPDLTIISEIVVNTFDIAIEATGPNQNPKSIGEARFSLNYLLAVALHQGFVGLDDFTDEAIIRTEIRETAKKVKAYSTKEWNDLYPDVRGAEIIITTKCGRHYSQKIDRLSGMAGDHEEVKNKFKNASRKRFSDGTIHKIIHYVAEIEKQTDVSEIMGFM